MRIIVGGDLGDSFCSLKVLREIGGTHQVLFADRGPTKIVDRSPLIKELFESQPYIESTETECSEENADLDLTGFRRWHSSSTALWDAQAAEYTHQTGLRLQASNTPWIEVDPDRSFDGKVAIARSERYNNHRCEPMWEAAVSLYGPRLIFLGLPHEHAGFTERFGWVPHLQVKDFLQMAKVIAGCSLFIGNQSSPHALAMALGCPIVQETCDYQPDVILNRANVRYVCDGEVTLPDVSGSGERHIPPFIDIPENFNRSLVPPGCWQYPKLPDNTIFDVQKALVAQLENCSQQKAADKLFVYNALRVPHFFCAHGTSNDPMGVFKIAHRNAFGVSPKKDLSITIEKE